MILILMLINLRGRNVRHNIIIYMLHVTYCYILQTYCILHT